MSSYIEFYLRGKDDNFYPLGTYCRNNAIYEMFDAHGCAKWGRVVPLTSQMLELVRRNTRDHIAGWKKVIRDIKKGLEVIDMFDVSFEEKVEIVESRMAEIESHKEKVKELKRVISFCDFLEDILEDAEYSDAGIDKDNYIYAGIEVGLPTIEDIF